MTKSLVLQNVTAHYGRTQVLQDLNLEVGAGQFVSLLGASGCGKTTTLRLVAGFLAASGGRILLGGEDIAPQPPHRRDIGLVFQNYALFPHLSVFDNVAFGLKQRKVGTEEIRSRVTDMLERVGLAALADRFPGALSGGQKQRVALARALVIRPSLLMFDEPLSNLDAKLRVDMRVEIRELQQQYGTTAVYVTHDQEEAFSISDRVAIMDRGRISQFDTPERLYRQPANDFVARFVGFENLLPLRIVSGSADEVLAEGDGGATLRLDRRVWEALPETFTLGARADGFVVEPATAPATGDAIEGSVQLRTYLGRSYQYKVASPFGTLIANGPMGRPFEAGDRVRLTPVVEQCCILDRSAA
jgi:putative spermidine/putrescine transport system ATP-binding protein